MKKETQLILAGKNPFANSGTINVPIHKTSTIAFPNWESYMEAQKGVAYYEEGRDLIYNDFGYAIGGTPTTFALRKAISSLEGSNVETLIFPSGLSAIATSLIALLKPNDHILVTDSVYGPTRRLCNNELKKYGIKTSFYEPTIGEEITKLITKDTKILYLENPGSQTFEIQDIDLLVAIAKKHNLITIIDNSWATPIYFDSFKKNIDISIIAGTKYIGGHSDVFLGTVSAKGEIFLQIYKSFKNLGMHTSPDDCYLALRGLKTMATRLKTHEESGLKIARWLESNLKVKKILHPAIESHPRHHLWKRDFTGSTGLFSIILDKHYEFEKICNFINSLKYFTIGASWGGYESLITHCDSSIIRTASKRQEIGSCIRLFIGLEHVDDLIEDLEQAFDKL